MKIMKWLLISAAVLLLVFWDQSYFPDDTELSGAAAAAADHCALSKLPSPETKFATDACSLWPNSMAGRDWSACCVAHDAVYWCGGSPDAKAEADRALRECIGDIQPGMGMATWAVMKVTHHPYFPFPWRFGNAFSYTLDTAPF